MGFVIRYVGLGLLPLWIAIFVVLFDGIHAYGEYWSVAPWLILAAIPVCAVSLAIVALISWATPVRAKQDLAHNHVPRPVKQKVAPNYVPHHADAGQANSANYRARAWIATGVIFAFCMAVFWLRYQAHRDSQALKQEQQELKSFVMHNAAVLAVEPNPHFWMPGGRDTWNDRPYEYEVGLRTEPYLAAIVLATHTDGRSSFSLECVTTMWMGERDPRLGSCQRPLDTGRPSVQAPTESPDAK